MAPIVELRDLRKSFGDNEAVKGITFTIDEGEIFSLLGPNGAGKSTTIGMLSTLLVPTAGDATVAGHSIRGDTMAVRAAIGVVPQEIALYETLSARENLLFWGRMHGLGGAHLRTRVAAVLDMIGLSDRAREHISGFSGGMKRRLNIGVGLLHEPRLVFMDEPTVGIDPQSRRAILDAVKALRASGLTVLYTTHYMEEAAELSDRVGIIDHGELIAMGTQAELTRLVGSKETLRLHLGEEEDAAALTAALAALPGVERASMIDGAVVAVVEDAETIIAPAITAANAAGVRVHSVDIEEPNLEAVFLHLTGRALRD